MLEEEIDAAISHFRKTASGLERVMNKTPDSERGNLYEKRLNNHGRIN